LSCRRGSRPRSIKAKPVAYAIGSPFDRLAVASDGNTAVAYFSQAGPDSEGFFRNPNELAIIKLSEAPSETNPTLKTIRSLGSVPDGISLSPPMVIPGATDPTPRVFAFVLALNNVTIIDATYPERNEVSIRLDTAGTNIQPKEIVFAPGASTAYLRSDNARDVLEVLLNYEPPAPNNTTPCSNRFTYPRSSPPRWWPRPPSPRPTGSSCRWAPTCATPGVGVAVVPWDNQAATASNRLKSCRSSLASDLLLRPACESSSAVPCSPFWWPCPPVRKTRWGMATHRPAASAIG